MNSLTVLLAFLGFTALGYASLVRLLFKHEAESQGSKIDLLRAGLLNSNILTQLAGSALFISLPAVSFLLFWGWAPALLWLVVFHLLVETPANFFATKMLRQVDVAGHFNEYDSFRGLLRTGLLQLLLIVIAAQLLAFLATIFDQRTGLLFLLFAVLFCLSILRNARGTLDFAFKAITAVAVFILGLVLAKNLGIAVFGSWAPLPDLASWLRFENKSLLALLLLFVGIKLTRSALHSGAPHGGAPHGGAPLGDELNTVLKVAGVAVIGLLVIILVKLIWQQPALDAPLLNTLESATKLPSFASMFLFISAAMVALLLQFLRFENPDNPDTQEHAYQSDPQDSDAARPIAEVLLSNQAVAVITLLFSMTLVLYLASASGIGAWNTHYANWDPTVSVQAHFDLVLRSMHTAIDGLGNDSINNEWLNVLLFTAIALLGLAGFTLFLALFYRQTELANQSHVPWISACLGQSTISYGLLFVLCVLLLNYGLQIPLWIGISVLCWSLCCDVLLDYAADLEELSTAHQIRRGFALTLFTIGALQLIWLGIQTSLSGSYPLAIGAFILLCLALSLCLNNALRCLKRLRTRSDTQLFVD